MADDRLDLLSPEARRALTEAEVVVGARRQLWLWQAWSGRASVSPGGHAPEVLEVDGDVEELARTVRQRAVEGGRQVCVLAPGDPGFFGLLPALLRLLDRHEVRVLPAPSPVSVAFARLSVPWDDAVVLDVAGRPLAEIAGRARVARKAAVLTSAEAPPEAVGRALVDAGAAMDLVAVCTGLGSEMERVLELSLNELAEGSFDPGSVVVLVGPGGLPLVGWGAEGRPGGDQAGPETPEMSELQAVVSTKLALPGSGILWCVGREAGEMAIHCARLQRGLTILAVTRTAAEGGQTSVEAVAAGAAVHVVTGPGTEVLEDLPAPDRVFLGEPDRRTLEGTLERLRPGGRVVCTFRSLQDAADAAARLGRLVQVGLADAEALPEGGWALSARNPLFVGWGPSPASSEPG